MESTSNSNLVLGEAPESDEDEPMPSIVAKMSNSSHADIVAGEASESDEEISSTKLSSDFSNRENLKSTSEISSSDTQTHSTNKPTSANVQYDSILHRKLREHNYSLQTSIKDFLHQNTSKAVRTLNSSNQHLMKTQIMLQETASALKHCSSNMRMVQNKLSYSVNSVLIPDINIRLPPPIPRSYS